MKIKISKWILLVILTSTNAIAQFQVADTKDPSTGELFPFPTLSCKQHPEIARKINESLQKSELGSVITTSTNDPFANLKFEDVYECEVHVTTSESSA